MAVLLDVSAIVAAADTADLSHAAARAWFARVDEPLLLGALTLGEADHVLQRELGQPASLVLVEALTSGAIRVVAPANEDLVRAAALLVEHAEHRPRLSDPLLVAAAERLGVHRIATFDRRPLAVLAPRGARGSVSWTWSRERATGAETRSLSASAGRPIIVVCGRSSSVLGRATRWPGRSAALSMGRDAARSVGGDGPEPTDAAPLELGGVVRQVGLFESANGFPHGVEAVVVGVVIGLVALLGRPVARLLRSVTRW